MSERLKQKLNNWIKGLSSKTIIKDDLQNVIWSNKDFRTEGQLNSAIEYLTSLGYNIVEEIIESDDIIDEQQLDDEETFLDEMFSEDEDIEDINLELFDEMLSEENEGDSPNSVEILDSIEELFDENKEKTDNKVYSGFSAYLHDLRDINTTLLTQEEEIDLVTKAQADDSDAREELITHNLRLVINIAKYYYRKLPNKGVLDIEDLVQEGNIGLMVAVTKFKPELGYKFSTYATYWIRQHIINCITHDSRTIRLPSHLIDLVMMIRKIQNKYLEENDEFPTEEYIASYINKNDLLRFKRQSDISSFEIKQTIRYWENQGLISLSMPVGEEEDSTLGDFIPSQTYAPNVDSEREDLLEKLNAALPMVLTEREVRIIKQRFALNKENKNYTLKELGIEFHMTGERIRQIESKALRKLKRSHVGKMLQEYFTTPKYNE